MKNKLMLGLGILVFILLSSSVLGEITNQFNPDTTHSGYIRDTDCGGTGTNTLPLSGSLLYAGTFTTGAGIEARGFLMFDTSSIPDNANITNAVLGVYLLREFVEAGDLKIYDCDYGSALENADFTTSLGEEQGVILTPTSATSAWHTLSINVTADNISKTGITHFCFDSDFSPTCADTNDLWEMDNVNQPYLNVTYTVPTPYVDWNQSALNLGNLQPGSKTANSTIISLNDNKNVIVTNIAGDGGVITATPANIGNMSDAQTQQIMFNCSSQTAGYYEAIFNVNSSEDGHGDNITVSCNIDNPPAHAQPILNSTSGTDTADENLTVYPQNVSDPENDAVYNITDWRLNGTSIAVLNLPFDAEENSTKDFSTYLQSVSEINIPISASSGGKPGGFYNFSTVGAGLVVSDSDSLDITDAITMEAWVNVKDYTNWDIIFGKPWNASGDPWAIYLLTLGGNNNYAMRLTSGGVDDLCPSAVNSTKTGAWQHVAGVWNGTHIQIYVDGTASGSACAFAGPLDANDEGVNIGYSKYGSQYHYDGLIDNVKLYDRALTAEQILANYNSGNPDYRTIVSQETNLGDIWQAAVTPADGIYLGTTLLSNNLTIIEEPQPSGPAVIITWILPEDDEEIYRQQSQAGQTQKTRNPVTFVKNTIGNIYSMVFG
jgi:hypothetical protein